MKLIKNKKGYGVAVSVFLGLFFLFVLGLLFTIFSNIIDDNLNPVFEATVNLTVTNSTLAAEILDDSIIYDKIWLVFPIVMILAVVLYLFRNSSIGGTTE